MSKLDRIEDLAPLWRTRLAEKFLDLEARKVRQAVEEMLEERVNTGDRYLAARIGQAVSDSIAQRVRESILPACLAWVREQGQFGDEFAEVRTLNELRGAYPEVAAAVPWLPTPSTTVRNQAWALPSTIGAALGGGVVLILRRLLLPELDVLAVLAGAILGAAGLVWLIAWVASRPKIVAGLETGMKWGGVAWVPVMFWRGLRGRPMGWIPAGVLTLGAWLVLATVRPRVQLPGRGEVLDALEGSIRGQLAHQSDLVLAVCWAGVSQRDQPEAGTPEPALGGSVFRAIRDVRATLRRPSTSREDLGDAVEGLLQRLEEDAYEWVELVPGMPYDESMDLRFKKFGKIDVGQPVEMHQPALVRHDVVIEPGLLRRLRFVPDRGE